MPVRVKGDGRREVVSEVEIPGTPEEVWELVATGPGISSWFVPTRTEGDDARPSKLICSFGPGMEAIAEILEWSPPQSFCAEAPWGPGVPPVATEWHVEAKSGGTCVVRVVHSMFASTDDWDDQLEGTEHGWATFFAVLALRQEHFRGLAGGVVQASLQVGGGLDHVWARAEAQLGLRSEGEVHTPWGASGRVLRHGESEAFALLRAPAPGLLHLSAMPMGEEEVLLTARQFHYGADVTAPDEGALRDALAGL
ncbi:MAG: SRPBCC domain-containing protein [Myxococcota bacterium]